MKRINYLIRFLPLCPLIALFVFGCAASKKDAVQTSTPGASVQASPDTVMFDPTKLGDDGIFPSEATSTSQKSERVISIETAKDAAAPVETPKREAPAKVEEEPIPEKFQKEIKRWEEQERPGWRVQILATTMDKQARDAQREAVVKFSEGVYIIYDPPMYKLRVGNCETREEAQELRKFAVALGYRDAWIVRDKIIAKVPIRD